MLSTSTLTLSLLLFLSLSITIEAQEIKSARLLDLLIRDYIFKSYTKNFKTGKLHKINLPSNLSGIHVEAVRLRCGSLHRYGAAVKEFHLSAGTRVYPCSKRVMIVRQNLGVNWSSLYYDNFDLSGYRLISPVLGLLAYNVGETNSELGIQEFIFGGANNNYINERKKMNGCTPLHIAGSASANSELRIQAGRRPVTVDFTSTAMEASSGMIPLCARFDEEGKVSLTKQAGENVCVAAREGHYGLVVEAPLMPLRRRMSKWRMAVGGSIGAAVGAFLLGLLAVAVVVKVKKKARMEEMERRAYEEEALRVSMVGHVRAVTASGTRTLPHIEHHDHHHHKPKPPLQ